MNVICLYYFLFKSLVLYYTYFMFYIFIYSKCTYIELYWTRFGWPILLSTIFGCIFILLVLRETASYLLFSSVGLCCCFSSSDLCWRGVWLCLKTLYKHGQALFLTKSCKWGITFFCWCHRSVIEFLWNVFSQCSLYSCSHTRPCPRLVVCVS